MRVKNEGQKWGSKMRDKNLSDQGHNSYIYQLCKRAPLPTAIYWTLPPGSFFKGKIEKMKVMGPFEIWNKQNVARTPLVTSTSPPPPFALFWNVTFSVPKRDTTFWVDCIDSTVPLPPKHIKSIIDSLSYQQTFTFTFLQLFLCVLPGRNVE